MPRHAYCPAVRLARVFVLILGHAMASCATSPRGPEHNGPPITLIVRVVGARAGIGPVRCAIYRDASRFMTRDGIWQGASIIATDGTAQFSFTVATGSRIAVSVFQDLDGDAAFDRGAMGVPVEPWGTSGKFSAFLPPSWQHSSIVPEVDGSEIVISLALAGGAPGSASR